MVKQSINRLQLPVLPGFLTRLASTQTLTTATITKIVFGAEIFDDGNNLSGGDFTAPYDGKYTFCWGAQSTGSDAVLTLLYLNGTNYLRGGWDSTTSTSRSSNGSAVLKLSAGDVVDIRGYLVGTGAQVQLRTGEYTFFSGIYNGP